MKTTISSILILLYIVQVEPDANIDYFVMNEAYILERRSNEDANAGYPPFYMECRHLETENSCFPAIPTLDENEAYVTIAPKRYSNVIYYGCMRKELPSDEFNPDYYKKSLTMKRAQATSHPLNHHFDAFFNIYLQKCESEVMPIIWRMGHETSLVQHYQIGFMIDGHENMPLAEVHFDNIKQIPLRTKHALYGKSLAAPTVAFQSLEELVFEKDLDKRAEIQWETTLQYYYEFNSEHSGLKNEANIQLTERKLDTIPETSKISMAHLIPEYDMIQNSWKKVARYAHTITPMWTDLYENEWADVENKIREVAFMNEKTFTVFSGTHGQLTFDYVDEDLDNKFHLGGWLSQTIPVTEIFWKLVIEEGNELSTKKAIVIIMRNLTTELKKLNIFTKFKPPCESKCIQFHWDSIEIPNLIYCCDVKDVIGIIDEFPEDIKTETFRRLYGNYFKLHDTI